MHQAQENEEKTALPCHGTPILTNCSWVSQVLYYLDKLQKGTLRRVPRANGNWSWEWRYINPANGKQDSKYLRGDEFPSQAEVEEHLRPFIKRLNKAQSDHGVLVDPTVSDLLDKFIEEESLLEIKKRKPGERAPDSDLLAFSTASSYLSLCNRIREKWGTTKLDEFEPLDFQKWLKELKREPKTKGHLKAFVNRLFNKAKLFGMVDFHENPIGLVEVRGISKRSKKPTVLTIEQFFLLLGLLPEPYFTMTLSAQCTGLRIEEILVLNWEKIDFERLCMKIEEAVVHGRIGPVKSEYSQDELPLDPSFATVLLDWKRQGTGIGLVFPSHITGRCYHASPLQQDWIRRAGWCLVACPECGAEPGIRCSGFPVRRSKRPPITVHAARRAAATAAGFGSIGWHTCRHTYRSLLSDADTPLEVQQKLMRHADIRTTTQYGEVPMRNKRAANTQAVRAILNRRSAR